MSFIKSAYSFALDILFPIKCIGCKIEFEDKEPRDRWICESCLAKIPLRKMQACPVCEEFSEEGKTHYRCRNKTSLDGLWVASEYKYQIISDAIHKLKFNFAKDVSFPLSKIVIKSVMDSVEFSDFHDILLSKFSKEEEEKLYLDEEKNKKPETIIIPVPLHKKRLNWRGFNQAFLLSKYVANQFGLDLREDLIKRARNTKPQTKIRSLRDRKENIINAFYCPQDKCLVGKNVVIIDDVCTTLATMNECAKVAQKAGAENIWGLVVARR